MASKQAEIIGKTKKPLTKNDIVEGLKKLGIKADSKLEVHASLSAFGFVVNKAYDLVDALMDVVKKGVIIVPAHTSEMTNPRDWENPPVPESWFEIIEENRKAFDPEVFIPERVGVFAQTFEHYPNVLRTYHPEVSLSVYNQTDDPHWLDHGFDDRDCIHPLYKLQAEGGKILMMGTDFKTVSSIHLTEYLSDYASLSHYDYKIKMGNEFIKKTITTKYFDDDDLNFDIIAKRYIDTYKGTDDYKQVELGLATLTLIDAKKLFDIAKDFHLNYKKD